MQQAEEARWRHNAEFFRPWLLSELVYEGEPVTTLAEVDEVQRKRLMQIGEDNRLKQQTSQRAAEDWTTSEGNFRALDHEPASRSSWWASTKAGHGITSTSACTRRR